MINNNTITLKKRKMMNFTKDEKNAMIIAISQIGTIDDNRKYARTSIMLRFQDMLGIDNFEMIEYSNTKVDRMIPTLQAMSNEKKKFYVKMMLALMLEDGQLVDSERSAFETLVRVCQIPLNIVESALEEVTNNK